MIRAAIFDLDGLLVDSEPLWGRAESEIFATVGLHLSPEACRETSGVGIDDVVALRHARHPWEGKPLAVVSAEIVERMTVLLRTVARPMPGAEAALAEARRRGLRVGLASSSHPEVIAAALEGLGLRDAFDHVQSAVGLSHRKPHPAVFLETAARLDAPAPACLAFEDSVPGVIAAKAARMVCVAVPEPHNLADPRFAIADHRIPSLQALDWDAVLASAAA